MEPDDNVEKIEKLTRDEILKLLKNSELDGFRHNNASISKIFRFKTFNDAITFMVESAKTCDEMNHHPNCKNIYDRVEVDLSTHDVLGVTQADIDLAKAMNKAASSL